MSQMNDCSFDIQLIREKYRSQEIGIDVSHYDT